MSAKQKRGSEELDFSATPNKKSKATSTKKVKDPFAFDDTDELVVWKPTKKPTAPKAGTPKGTKQRAKQSKKGK